MTKRDINKLKAKLPKRNWTPAVVKKAETLGYTITNDQARNFFQHKSVKPELIEIIVKSAVAVVNEQAKKQRKLKKLIAKAA